MRIRQIAVGCLALQLGCGSSQEKPTRPQAAEALCDAAERRLSARLGPELSRVESKRELTRPGEADKPPQAWACVLVYQPVPEEMAEEGLPPEDLAASGIDHQLAVGLANAKGQVEVHLVEPSTESPGAVSVELEMQDVAGDSRPEVVVTEASVGAEPWRGIRLLSLDNVDAGPRDLLSTSLKLKTTEGLELFGSWKATREGGRPGVVLEAGGNYRIYAWEEGAKRFMLDQAATDAANPKPPPPPSAAPTEAPTSPPSAAPKKRKKDAAPKPAKDETPLEVFLD
jgi:hypothetical protein